MPPKPPTPTRLTHFLCIPLITPTSEPQLLSSLSAFRVALDGKTKESPEGIPDAAVRPLGTLHLTLGVMSLPTAERVGEALRVLRAVDLRGLLGRSGGEDSLSGKGERGEGGGKGKFEELRITLRGLESMHPPSKTSVLYTSPVDADKRLYTFCSALRSIFQDRGLVVRDERPLLLHATLLNTVYVPGKERDGRRRGKLVLDARGVLEGYRGVEWMRGVRVERIAICRMGARKGVDGEERYVVEGEVEMPV